MATWPRLAGRGVRISACLIVRDEAARIESCLASLVGRVDEIVVVDTGSVDDTMLRTRPFGVVEGRFDWCDDFAAARNHALSLSTGDWVLSIDADERLNGDLRAFAASPVADGGLIMLEPDRVWLLRLFRRSPDLEWQHRVHEEPTRWARRRASRIRPVTTGCLVHAQPDPARSEARNRRLLDLRRRDDPLDPVPVAYLARMALARGDLDACDLHIRDGLAILCQRDAAGLPETAATAQLLTLRVVTWARAGKAHMAADLVERALGDGIESADLLACAILLGCAADQTRLARRLARRLRACYGEVCDRALAERALAQVRCL